MADTDRHKQTALTILLTQTEGWKYVLQLIFQLMQNYDAHARNVMGYTADLRQDALSRATMLVELVAAIYKEAGLVSPLQEHYAALWAAMRVELPPEPFMEKAEPLTALQAQDLQRRVAAQRRRAGSVA